MERDSYGDTKLSDNYDKAKKWKVYVSKWAQAEKCHIKIIIDGVLLHGFTVDRTLEYFKTVPYVLKHHHTTLNLNIYKLFQDKCKFLWMYIALGGTQPAYIQNDDFSRV